MITTITSPTLVLDKKKCLSNIRFMSFKAKDHGLKFRPHFKTHQSLEIGRWFKEYPINGITVSSLKMAEFFANDGWNSITIAFPVNILEYKRIDTLASKIDLRVLVVSAKTAAKLDKKLTTNLGVYIEIDPGYGRSGIPFNSKNEIEALNDIIESSKNLNLVGFYSHAGHSYKSRSKEDILECIEPIIIELNKLKKKYNLPVCYGDTPSCSVLDDFGDIDEISPGNFVFYDWIQTKIGSCDHSRVAVAKCCPIVAKYAYRNELLIHGGAVHFSKDFDLDKNKTPYFGQVVEKNNNGWGASIDNCYLKSISQEHGIISCTKDYFDSVEVGDFVYILPIHSCLTANLMGSYLTNDNHKISHLSQKMI